MRKLLFLILLIPSLSFSQEVGLKGGVLVSDLKSYSTSNSLLAPNLGLFLSAEFGMFRLMLEPSYIQKGDAFKMIYFDVNGNPIREEKRKSIYRFIELPVSFGIYPLHDDLLLGINAGIAPGYILSSNVLGDYKPFQLDLFGTIVLGGHISDRASLALHIRFAKGLNSLYENSDLKYSYFSPFMTLGFDIGD